MRRYELMLVLRPDTADDRVQQILDRTTRGIAASEGQIVKVSPWGRRRLAYPISGYNEGSYFIVVFDAPGESVDELERGLNITEEVMRHLVTRIERPIAADVIDRLCRVPEFVRSFEPDGMPPSEFITYGATQRTLSQFIQVGWAMLEAFDGF